MLDIMRFFKRSMMRRPWVCLLMLYLIQADAAKAHDEEDKAQMPAAFSPDRKYLTATIAASVAKMMVSVFMLSSALGQP
jgi:hypothetical protein